MLGSPYLSNCGRLGSWCGLEGWTSGGVCACLEAEERRLTRVKLQCLCCVKKRKYMLGVSIFQCFNPSTFQVPKNRAQLTVFQTTPDFCGSQEFVARGSTPRRTTRAKVLNSSDTVSRGSTPRSTHLRGTYYVPETLTLDQRGATPCPLGDPVGI